MPWIRKLAPNTTLGWVWIFLLTHKSQNALWVSTSQHPRRNVPFTLDCCIYLPPTELEVTFCSWILISSDWFFSFYWGLLRHSVQLLAGAENSSADAGTGILPPHSKVPYWKNWKRRCHSVSKDSQDFQTIAVVFSFFALSGSHWNGILSVEVLVCACLDAWHPFVLIHLFLRQGLQHDISTMISDV